jgi:hypothetical protein
MPPCHLQLKMVSTVTLRLPALQSAVGVSAILQHINIARHCQQNALLQVTKDIMLIALTQSWMPE